MQYGRVMPASEHAPDLRQRQAFHRTHDVHREVARAHRVPLVANPPLARVLHFVELDREIPAEHFQAVAEIIAYVWRLNRRVRR